MKQVMLIKNKEKYGIRPKEITQDNRNPTGQTGKRGFGLQTVQGCHVVCISHIRTE